jgi:hypothetical protein
MPMRSHLSPKAKFSTCSICNESVELETAKVDERGQPVHEECYARKLASKKPVRKISTPANAAHFVSS